MFLPNRMHFLFGAKKETLFSASHFSVNDRTCLGFEHAIERADELYHLLQGLKNCSCIDKISPKSAINILDLCNSLLSIRSEIYPHSPLYPQPTTTRPCLTNMAPNTNYGTVSDDTRQANGSADGHDEERAALLGKPEGSSLRKRLVDHMTVNVSNKWADIALLGSYIITGLLDSCSVFIWGSFLSMQTGMLSSRFLNPILISV